MILEHILLHDAEHIDEKEKLENARKLLFWAGYYLANAKPNHAARWGAAGFFMPLILRVGPPTPSPWRPVPARP